MAGGRTGPPGCPSPTAAGHRLPGGRCPRATGPAPGPGRRPARPGGRSTSKGGPSAWRGPRGTGGRLCWNGRTQNRPGPRGPRGRSRRPSTRRREQGRAARGRLAPDDVGALAAGPEQRLEAGGDRWGLVQAVGFGVARAGGPPEEDVAGPDGGPLGRGREDRLERGLVVPAGRPRAAPPDPEPAEAGHDQNQDAEGREDPPTPAR